MMVQQFYLGDIRMAKRAAKSSASGNKSQAIRDYLKQHPDSGPTAVAAALNAREGWKISAAYVSTIKNKTRPSGKRARRVTARKAAGAGGAVNEKSLVRAFELYKQAGSINRAKAALDLLAKFTS
jgi:hypothetical protein